MVDSTSSTSGITIESLNQMLGLTSSSRVSGLVSGIDVDSIVAKMMLADSQPMLQMQQQLQTLEWQRDDYRSMNTLLSNLKTTTSSLQMDASFTSKKTTSSNESVVTATAGNTSSNGTYTFSNVNMAKAASVVGSAFDVSNDFDPATTKLSDSGINGVGGTVSFAIKTYGEDGEVIKSNGASNIDGIKVSYDEDKGNVFTIDTSKVTMDQVMSAINSSGIGVSAFSGLNEDGKEQISLTRTDEGNFNSKGDEIQLTDVTGSFLSATKLTDGSATKVDGTNASATVNGVTVTSKTNNITMNGTTFTLNGDSTGTTKVQVSDDTDALYKKITDFVDQYNDVVKQIDAKVNEKKDYDYKPLTAVQEKEMSESDIEKWTAKAKEGTLFSDDILQSALTQMRQSISTKVGNSNDPDTIDTLAEVGISTGYMSTDGTLEIDETKLKDALSKDPQAVINLFTQNGTGDDKSGTVDKSAGVMERLTNTINDTITKIEKKAGNDQMADKNYYMGQDISDMNDRIEAFKDHLQTLEDNYYTQFTAMEEAIQNANQQASYIQGFGS